MHKMFASVPNAEKVQLEARSLQELGPRPGLPEREADREHTRQGLALPGVTNSLP